MEVIRKIGRHEEELGVKKGFIEKIGMEYILRENIWKVI